MSSVDTDSLISGLRGQVEDVLQVESYTMGRGGGILFAGRLVRDAESAWDLLHQRLRPRGYLPFLQRRGNQDTLFLAPAPPDFDRRTKVRFTLFGIPIATLSIHLLLFLATVLTTLYAGATQEGYDPLRNPLSLRYGVSFAFPLLLILGTHEMGHFVVARLKGMRVSLPYFIPVPFGLGTFGAVIRMDSPVKDRKAFFDVGLAGPLAGLLVAIPVIILGLAISPVRPIVLGPGILHEGNSILYLALKYLVFGEVLPGGGFDVYLNPVAFSGWLGLFLTAVNLLPAGQLDGGHVSYALFGKVYNRVSLLTVALMLVLGFTIWQGWLLWAFFIMLSGPSHPRPMNDISNLDAPRYLIGALAGILMLLLITPVPFS